METRRAMCWTDILVAMAIIIVASHACSTTVPLHLSPYIARGELETARELSKVIDTCDPEYDFGCDAKIPESYAGFLTVNETVGRHTFFWYFPAQ
ncbi:carboxypeptidase, partial [Elysia marginata]